VGSSESGHPRAEEIAKDRIGLTNDEFSVWRGLLRLNATIRRELDHRLQVEQGISLRSYGLMMSIFSTAERRLRMSELASRQMVSPSNITRLVQRLEVAGLVLRETDTEDARGSFAVLTSLGVARLEEAQLTYHATVRDRFLSRLTTDQVADLTVILEAAHPGLATSEVWDPQGADWEPQIVPEDQPLSRP
jgi:DNA-binding MarR family transcriptional regulator